nr:hypothetical protein [Tanacetum cinerariifolium]
LRHGQWTLEEGKECCVMSKAAKGGRGKRKVSLSLEGLVMLTLRENGVVAMASSPSLHTLKVVLLSIQPKLGRISCAFIERASDLGFPKKIPFIGALFTRTVHRPTTLGEAFSLARIAEARYKDERPTIAIAKPNDLTARVDPTHFKGDVALRVYRHSCRPGLLFHMSMTITKCGYPWVDLTHFKGDVALRVYRHSCRPGLLFHMSMTITKCGYPRTLEEGKRCCIISKAAEGGRGKRVLATAAEDGTMLF